jgi:DNA-binding PadR family transcriptional regulator
MAPDPRDLLPLKPLVFQVLLTLGEGERHGWSLVREAQAKTGTPRLLPANFYRTLRRMLADGLIEESGRRRPADDDERRRYFRLTALGQQVARLEAKRLQDLMADARTKRLLKTT